MTSAAAAPALRVIRSSPGRIRMHLPEWDGSAPRRLEAALQALPGVSSASARAQTGNALVTFEPSQVSAAELMDAVGKALPRGQRASGARAQPQPEGGGRERAPAESPAAADSRPSVQARAAHALGGVLRESAGRFGRARIAVRGIDRDPQLARRVVTTLERRPEVKRAVANATTGRVLVEFSQRVSSIQDLLADVSDVELPDTPGEDRPGHPLDPAPVIQSGARLVGAGLGLGLVALQRGLGVGGGGTQAAATVAGTLGIVDGAPPVRDALRHSLGRDRAQLLLGGATIASLTLSGSPLGLLVSGAGALRVFTEARQRREAWREYEQRLRDVADPQPGAVVRLQAGQRVPLPARVLEGVGTVVGDDGLPDGVQPGAKLGSGSTVIRGPLVVELQWSSAWEPGPRPRPSKPDLVSRYVALLGPASLAYAALHAIRHRSLPAAFTGLLLVNPRAAVIGAEAADTGASARVLRAGVTVVGTRPERAARRLDVLVVDGPRALSSGMEQTRVLAAGDRDRPELVEMVNAMVAASGAPWGVGNREGNLQAEGAEFDGEGVTATVAGRRLRLEPPAPEEQEVPEAQRAIQAGELVLVLREAGQDAPIAYVHLRPRLAAGIQALRRVCERAGVEIAVLEAADRRASRGVAGRAEMPLVLEADLLEYVRERQRQGQQVAVLSDSPRAAEAFEACDLAIGLSSGRSSHFQARADLLAPGVPAVAAIIDATARREQAAGISVGLSLAANIAGVLWGLQGEPGVLRASYATYVAALGALGASWERLRGGARSRSVISRLTDPRPERWGELPARQVLEELRSRPQGLSTGEAEARVQVRERAGQRNAFVAAMAEQLESPLVAVLGAGAAISLTVGAVADVAIIGAVIVANAAVGAWQERQAGRAAQALERIGATTGRVLRDGEVLEIPGEEVVRGDILLLSSGDRVVADARLLEADALECDEAALTGESLPVTKDPDAGEARGRIVMDGSDVTVGTGRAVVVAVGSGTRLGATAAALAVEETRTSPLGQRLDRLFRQGMPVVVAGGLLVTVAGIAWGGAPLTQLAVGASVAVAAVPEGLPLLAGVAEASVARRLATRNAYVRRLSSVEALGRVDVVCADKTGTLTRGQLEVTVLDDSERRGTVSAAVPAGPLRELLLCAGLASPAPDAPDAGAHATDVAVLSAAASAGLEQQLLAPRSQEAPFDPVRSVHATAVEGRVCIKGAAEVLVGRCSRRLSADGSVQPLGEPERQALLRRAEAMAGEGLRVLMVAEGAPGTALDDPQDLTAHGFVGISDPPREGAAEALARCRAAGIRVIMLTGDHPATAGKIAAELGLSDDLSAVVTGEELQQLDNGELHASLEGVAVIGRITPIDKLRVVEALRAAGHTVAMTGDGVNDAPALRLADVGVAMGEGGTEVARQAADLVLGDDRFETLTEALLEGRSLWQNLHRALGLLLGGNLGEVAMMAGAALAGRGTVLGTRQILAINLVTDVLPAVAVAVQPPRERELSSIMREGAESFDAQLVGSILQRGAATALPSLAALIAAPLVGAQATVVAFGSIIITQLAQTLQSGARAEQLSTPVAGGVAAATAVLAGSLALPPLRRFLGLPVPVPQSLLLMGATAPAAVALAALWPQRNGSALHQDPRGGVLIGRQIPEPQQQLR